MRVYLKSAACGFALGSILFAIAPLGLGIYIIEFLKPLLVPGLLITQLLIGNSIGPTSIAIALMLNGFLFTIPFLVYFLTKARTKA